MELIYAKLPSVGPHLLTQEPLGVWLWLNVMAERSQGWLPILVAEQLVF